MSSNFPPCPASLKSIQHYLKTAVEHDQRDPVVSYWCRVYAVQCGLKIDKKSDETKAYLFKLMDWLESQKKSLAENEAITNDVVAQAHIENYALKLFIYADTQDRASNFGKNVVKAFYTSGMLYDVLQTFGVLTEEIIQNRKYAKWKAAYIHNCLKNGETPIPGPISNENEAEGYDENLGAVGGPDTTTVGFSSIGFVQPPGGIAQNPSDQFPQTPPSFTLPAASSSHDAISPSPGSVTGTYHPGFPSTPNEGVDADFADLNSGFSGPSVPGDVGKPAVSGGIVLKPEQITKAQKYCKWASSALNYDDIPTAISNLQKAINLLQTGVDS